MIRLLALTLCLVLTAPAMAKKDTAPGKMKHLPPGLEKKIDRGKPLPPGWQKKIAKGEVLAPVLYDRAIIITGDRKEGYPKPMPGTELLRLEDRIIRIKNDTREILEIFGIDVDF